MAQQPITTDDLLLLLGAKEAENFLLRKQIALFGQQVEALTEQLKKEREEAKEEKAGEAGNDG